MYSGQLLQSVRGLDVTSTLARSPRYCVSVVSLHESVTAEDENEFVPLNSGIGGASLKVCYFAQFRGVGGA